MSQNESQTNTLIDQATEFAKDVLSEKIIAGPNVRNACKRHLKDLENGHERGLFYDTEAAKRAINYFEDVLCLNGGEYEGIPFVLLPWQAFIIGSLFGWKGADGWRRFRTAYIETGKGSGKSPLVAGIGLYGLMADKESRPEIYAAATKKDQAQILFRDAVAMVNLSPDLIEKLDVAGSKGKEWNIAYHKNHGFFRPISSDTAQSGPRPHVSLLDEIHEHKDRTVIDMMRAGVKFRRQALMVMITNSGHDKTSVCYEYHENGRQICDGTLEDDAFFAFICGLDDGDDPFKDEYCWYKANPSLQFPNLLADGTPDPNGGVPGLKYIRELVAETKGMPSKISKVRRLNFCQWVEAADPWITYEVWEACEKQFSITDIPEGETCYGGLDLSGVRDLTALALYFPRLKKAVVEFWTPNDTLRERTARDKVPYDVWRDKGFINTPNGVTVDYNSVAMRIAELQLLFDLKGIAFDPYRIKYLQKELDNENIIIELIQHGQGFFRATESGLWMPHSIELLEDDIDKNNIDIEFNPCLRWNAASAVIETDSKENRIFAKRKSTGRIDGVVALAMARGAAEDYEGDTNILEEIDEDDFVAW